MEERTEVVESTPAPAQRVTEINTGSRPVADVDRVDAVTYDPYAHKRYAAHRVQQMFWWIFGLIEGLIAIRFVLKALGANPQAGFAEFIYGLTAPLVAPFVGLFGSPQAQGSVLEMHSLVALVVYALLAWLLGKLAWILMGDTRSAVESRATTIDQRL